MTVATHSACKAMLEDVSLEVCHILSVLSLDNSINDAPVPLQPVELSSSARLSTPWLSDWGYFFTQLDSTGGQIVTEGRQERLITLKVVGKSQSNNGAGMIDQFFHLGRCDRFL